ncbi:hypothetical protein ACFVYR_37820 [Streptomyces sp. NPDC058284]|uniref:hypothetical protein n=1 Tax=unclassified Streptomyces TaxID=2593676 RepID=UPI003664C4C0
MAIQDKSPLSFGAPDGVLGGPTQAHRQTPSGRAGRRCPRAPRERRGFNDRLAERVETVSGQRKTVHNLSTHTTDLPLTATSAFVIWQGVGIVSLVLSWFTGAVDARLTWTAHGACSVFMVWDAAPAAGRPVAAALASWPGRSAASSPCAACPSAR